MQQGRSDDISLTSGASDRRAWQTRSGRTKPSGRRRDYPKLGADPFPQKLLPRSSCGESDARHPSPRTAAAIETSPGDQDEISAAETGFPEHFADQGAGLIGAVVGAIIILVIWGFVAGRRRRLLSGAARLSACMSATTRNPTF